MNNISEIIKSLREEKNISMDEMAEQLKAYGVNIAKSTISRWENGKAEPSMSYVRVLSKYFNVSLDYMIGLDNKKNNEIINKKEDMEFSTPESAMQFIIKQPAIAAYGGFDINKMSDEEIMDFANELLRQLKLLGYKYNK